MRQKKSLVTVGELVSLLSRRAEGLKAAGRHSSAMHAVAAQRSIEKYAKESGRGEERLCGETLRRYEAWLTDKGVCPNTTSFYMRTLRSALSASGHDVGIFREVYTGVAPTDKTALTRNELRRHWLCAPAFLSSHGSLFSQPLSSPPSCHEGMSG